MAAARSARDPNLDFVRAFAITSVMVAHLPHAWENQGAFGHGVDIFFVLSGFLIGRIFLNQERRGLGPLRFWSDRWFRTLPAYYFVLLGGLVVGSFIGRPWKLADFGGKLWEYLIFAQNYDVISLTRAGDPFPVSWSLCVEEQFYLVLPLLLLMARSRPARLVLVAGVIVAAPVARRVVAADWQRFWMMTHIRFDGIGFGLLAAFLAEWRPAWMQRLRPWARPVAAAWVALIAARCFGWPWALPDYLTVLNATTALVVASCAGAPPLPLAVTAWSRWGALLAYSIYLTHTKTYGLVSGAWNATPLRSLPPVLMVSAMFAGALLPALALYYLVERPGLALRERVRRRLGEPRPTHGPSSKL
jgi:peptidoglycan/LPS O-acetylase OafA/YrhL